MSTTSQTASSGVITITPDNGDIVKMASTNSNNMFVLFSSGKLLRKSMNVEGEFKTVGVVCENVKTFFSLDDSDYITVCYNNNDWDIIDEYSLKVLKSFKNNNVLLYVLHNGKSLYTITKCDASDSHVRLNRVMFNDTFQFIVEFDKDTVYLLTNAWINSAFVAFRNGNDDVTIFERECYKNADDTFINCRFKTEDIVSIDSNEILVNLNARILNKNNTLQCVSYSPVVTPNAFVRCITRYGKNTTYNRITPFKHDVHTVHFSDDGCFTLHNRNTNRIIKMYPFTPDCNYINAFLDDDKIVEYPKTIDVPEPTFSCRSIRYDISGNSMTIVDRDTIELSSFPVGGKFSYARKLNETNVATFDLVYSHSVGNNRVRIKKSAITSAFGVNVKSRFVLSCRNNDGIMHCTTFNSCAVTTIETKVTKCMELFNTSSGTSCIYVCDDSDNCLNNTADEFYTMYKYYINGECSKTPKTESFFNVKFATFAEKYANTVPHDVTDNGQLQVFTIGDGVTVVAEKKYKFHPLAKTKDDIANNLYINTNNKKTIVLNTKTTKCALPKFGINESLDTITRMDIVSDVKTKIEKQKTIEPPLAFVVDTNTFPCFKDDAFVADTLRFTENNTAVFEHKDFKVIIALPKMFVQLFSTKDNALTSRMYKRDTNRSNENTITFVDRTNENQDVVINDEALWGITTTLYPTHQCYIDTSVKNDDVVIVDLGNMSVRFNKSIDSTNKFDIARFSNRARETSRKLKINPSTNKFTYTLSFE